MFKKEASKKHHGFAFLPTSDHILPLDTIKEKFISTCRGLTWPLFKKILKANLALTIALGLMFYRPLMEIASVSTALAPVAVEFILPSRSLGFIAEDAIFGVFMCVVSAAFTILGTYCASLVRDANDSTFAQPAVCGILVAFLIVGAFILNYVRAKVQQANVGGMLSALIMVLNLTGAVLDRTWAPIHVVISLLSAMAGFTLMFLVSLLISPENSTTVYVQELVKIMDMFDTTARQQVNGFFHTHQQNLMDSDSSFIPDPPALVHRKTDALLVSLIDKKRMARREISFNAVSPVDVNELTKIIKRLRVPLQGIAIAHTMESNMRKIELLQRVDEIRYNHRHHPGHAKESTTAYSPETVRSPPTPNQHLEGPNIIPNDHSLIEEEKKHGGLDLVSASTIGTTNGHSTHLPPSLGNSKTSILLNDRFNYYGPGSLAHRPSCDTDDEQQSDQVDSAQATSTPLSVSLDNGAFNFSRRRQQYLTILKKSRHIYIDLMSACSVAVAEDIKRLERMQGIDPKYQDKPFFYKYLFGRGDKRRPSMADRYDPNKDPAGPLLFAIQQFDAQRLTGLTTLYNENRQPRRSLLLILKFQFSLRTYAENLYTISSLIHDMERVRTRRRFWLPSLSIWKLFWKRRESSYDLDSPSGLAQQAGNSNMQRTMTQHTALIQSMIGNESFGLKNEMTTATTMSDMGGMLGPQDQNNMMEKRQQQYRNNNNNSDDMDGDYEDSDDESYDCDDTGLPTLNTASGGHTRQQRQRQRRRFAPTDSHHNSTTELARQLTLPSRGQVVCPQDNTNTWFHQHDRPKRRPSQRWQAFLRRRRNQPEDDNDDDMERQTSQSNLVRVGKLAVWRKQIGQRATTTTSVTPSVLMDPSSYHDPDASYPVTRTQRFFYILWGFGRNYIYTSDTLFAFRAAVLVTALTLPGFLEQSLEWYNGARCQWATVVALIWMGPSVGSSLFGTMLRTIGTLVGAAAGLVIWEICQRKVWAILVVTYIVNLPFYILYTLSVFWRATGLFCLITISLIIGYGYVYAATGVKTTVYQITYYRIASVLAGVAAAMTISIFPYAHTSRVQVRHRVSYILGDISVLYTSLMGMLLKGSRYDHQIKDTNQKLFRSFANTIRQQIHVTRALLDQSHYEPALRGVFPEKKYLKLLQVMDTMLNLMLQMELALEKVDSPWRLTIVNFSWTERKKMISAFLTALQLASNALMNKTPLPPYIIRPTTARRTLTDRVRQNATFSVRRLADPNYTYYSTYLMNSEQLAVEIEVLVATVRDLVGSDSISVLLEYIH
ncbi:unnamed protein product [Absidia cylindrospora]